MRPKPMAAKIRKVLRPAADGDDKLVQVTEILIDPRMVEDKPHLNAPKTGPFTIFQWRLLRDLGYR